MVGMLCSYLAGIVILSETKLAGEKDTLLVITGSTSVTNCKKSVLFNKNHKIFKVIVSVSKVPIYS